MPKGMIERPHPKLSVGAQCRLHSISRSSFHYAPQGETAMNLGLMLLVDKQFRDTPLAVPEIRMRLSARLGNRVPNQGRRWTLDHLLQPPAAPCRPWRSTSCRGLLQRNPN
jgi:hypothetical protein